MNDVTQWLESIGLAEHAPSFRAQGIEIDLLPDLGDADLKELGVAMLGHRKRILSAIAALKGGAAGSASPIAAREADRRQLTVMFCDLVGSTQLAGQLDPEDFQRLIRTYHDAVAAAVAPYAGHVAQLLGDGCLVYFGYPRAHEDDAERAVHAALNVLKSVATLKQGGIELQTRIGIATGLVVVGEIGAGTSAAEQTASGETPNLAARLQAHANAGEIILSTETRRLVGAIFEFESTGLLQLKGFATPIQAWRVRGERSVASRFEAQHQTELIEFIGRTSEVSLLLDRWNLAREGEGQVVLLTGEAGIGKSRICQTLRDRLASERHATALLQCSPYHSSSALYPLVQYFERATRIAPTDSPHTRGEKLAHLMGPEMNVSPQAYGRLLRLMGAPDGGLLPPAAENPNNEMAQLLQAPVELLRALTRQLPVLLLIEDAHWIDPTTEQLGALAVELARDTRLLVLVTARPEYTPPWSTPANLTRLALNRLGQKQCVELVSAVTAGRTLPAEVLAEIILKTDGIPLFVEELTKTVVQSGLLEEDGPGAYRLRGPLPRLAIPSTLQDSLMARLDRLAPAKEAAQVGAMIGREFSQSLLSEVLQLPAAKMAEALDELVRSELVARRGVEPDVVYTFRHALIRDTAYNSMLKGQRMLRHAQIAAAIEALEPDRVTMQPELLAHHCQEGGRTGDALRYWSAAGDLAMARAANREAMAHYRAALALVPPLNLPQELAEKTELDIQMKLGNVLMQAEGYASPSTVSAFARARELAHRLGQIDQYVVACSGFGVSMWAAGRFGDEQAMLGQIGPDDLVRLRPMSRVFHSTVLGLVKFHMGSLVESHDIARDTLRLIESIPADQRQDIGGVDPMIVTLTQLVAICANRGLLEQADAHTVLAMQIAKERNHAPSQVWALSLARWMEFRHGNWAESIRIAHENLALTERLGMTARLGSGTLLLGRAVVASGQVDEGAALLHKGFALWKARGSAAGSTELAAVAADALVEAGRIDDAEPFVHAGETAVDEIQERFFAAELARLRARLLQYAGDHVKAEQSLRSALAIAQEQGAALFSLRAATDLARLLHSQGRRDEAASLLEGALERMPEGLSQPDALRARATLRTLGLG